jgi:hypothetical protein
VVAALLVAVAVVIIVLVSTGGGDETAKAVEGVEARMAADDPAGVGFYTCDGKTGPEFHCYSQTGNCQGDEQYQVYYDRGNGTFRYQEQAPVRSNEDCDR